jgi:FkbM family methyltransferase
LYQPIAEAQVNPVEETERALLNGDRVPGMADFKVSTIIDVGTNTGQWVNEYIMDAGKYPDLKFVYCFEPHEKVFPYLEAHAKEHWTKQERVQVELYPYALGSPYKVQEDSFVRMDTANYCSSPLKPTRWLLARSPDVADYTVVDVKYTSLDEAVQEFGMPLIDDVLLKIDTQGFEKAVLHGALKTLQKVSWVQVEVMFDRLYEEQSTLHDLLEILEPAGFRYAGNTTQHGCPSSGAIMFADALFVRCPPRSKR